MFKIIAVHNFLHNLPTQFFFCFFVYFFPVGKFNFQLPLDDSFDIFSVHFASAFVCVFFCDDQNTMHKTEVKSTLNY